MAAWMCAARQQICGALRRRRHRVFSTQALSDASLASLSDAAARRNKGLHFEAQVVALMRSFECELRATQASQDGGIDHQGVWRLPDREVEVVTQCKSERAAVGVQALREFHGVLSFLSPGALGLFASSSGYSVYAQRYFRRMPHAAVLCTVENGRLASFLLNERAQTLLPKLTVGSLFVAHDHELVLTYGDQILGG